MFDYVYRVIEVVREETENTWGESIIRSKYYSTLEQAEEKMKTLQPIENGKLKIEKELKTW